MGTAIPIPVRKLEYENRYKKFQWIELRLSRNYSDVRPESFKVDDISQVELVGEPIGTQRAWAERKRIITERNAIVDDLTDLIARANRNELSLAIFKPTKVRELKIEAVAREWNKEKLDSLDAKATQLSLFQSASEVKKEFLCVNKLPYKFSYCFEDCNGRQSTMMIEDWEIGALYWNCLNSCEGDEDKALQLIRRRYFDEFVEKDIHFFLGTTKKFHGWAQNPFVIVGVFYPPHDLQGSLF